MPQITSTPTMPRAPCVHNLEDILDLAGSNVSLDVSALVCSSMVIIVVKAIVVTSILHSVNVPVFSCSLDRQNWMPPIFTVSGTILFWWGSTPFCAALQFMRRMKAVASCICVIEQKHVPPQRNVRLVCDRHVTDKNQSKVNQKFMFFPIPVTSSQSIRCSQKLEGRKHMCGLASAQKMNIFLYFHWLILLRYPSFILFFWLSKP